MGGTGDRFDLVGPGPTSTGDEVRPIGPTSTGDEVRPGPTSTGDEVRAGPTSTGDRFDLVRPVTREVGPGRTLRSNLSPVKCVPEVKILGKNFFSKKIFPQNFFPALPFSIIFYPKKFFVIKFGWGTPKRLRKIFKKIFRNFFL